jgi:hypothetical protein
MLNEPKNLARRIINKTEGKANCCGSGKAPKCVEYNTIVKGKVSRDNLYPIFLINHILLVLQEVLLEDLNFAEFS